MNRRRVLLGSLALAAGGCSVGPTQRAEIAVYDFGLAPLPKTRAFPFDLAVTDVAAPRWLDGNAIQYRQAFRDGARLRPYSLSVWAAPPAQLITQRLRAALVGAGTKAVVDASAGARVRHTLALHIDQFVQVFDAETSARALLSLRATLSDQSARAITGQRGFEIVEPCPSADAPGAVAALTRAADRAIGEVLDWAAGLASAR